MTNNSVNLGCSAPSIKCKDCKSEFVLMAVFRSTEPYQEADHSVAHQVGCFFCPYCGKPQDPRAMTK